MLDAGVDETQVVPATIRTAGPAGHQLLLPGDHGAITTRRRTKRVARRFVERPRRRRRLTRRIFGRGRRKAKSYLERTIAGS